MDVERLLFLHQLVGSTETVADLLSRGVLLGDLKAAGLLNVSEEPSNTSECFPPSCLIPPADTDLIVF